MLSLNEYQVLAMRTNGTTDLSPMLLNASLGLCGESGEFADTVKKLFFHHHPHDLAAQDKLLNELGDVLWYCAQAAEALGVQLGHVAEANVEKLRRRYPDRFNTEDSIARRDVNG